MKEIIEKAWDDRNLLQDSHVRATIEQVVENLDKGELRVADQINGVWVVNDWVRP
jgi:2,3,4,5-tetrahydropyridine-2,6-dicarboxylate N-succinyltransferase